MSDQHHIESKKLQEPSRQLTSELRQPLVHKLSSTMHQSHDGHLLKCVLCEDAKMGIEQEQNPASTNLETTDHMSQGELTARD